jgi:hypothetical protein
VFFTVSIALIRASSFCPISIFFAIVSSGLHSALGGIITLLQQIETDHLTTFRIHAIILTIRRRTGPKPELKLKSKAAEPKHEQVLAQA